jgi:mandelate racemase
MGRSKNLHQRLTVRAIRSVAVEVPMKRPLGTSAAAVTKAPLLLVDVQTEEGVVGRSYLFCYLRAAAPGIAAMLGEIERMTKGARIEPARLWSALARRFTLIGVQGVVRMAMSAFEIACWDALAAAADKPLSALLGGGLKPIEAYNSSGLGLQHSPESAADEAEELLVGGFKGVKVRLGHPALEQDLKVVRAIRRRLPDAVKLMVDYNQALTGEEAIVRGRALDAEGIHWLEEPIRHDDWRGCAEVARAVKAPVQIGENFSLPEQMQQALAHEACDLVMPDVERIGGVTGWMRAAAIAQAHRVEMSSHLAPEVSAHLLAVTPTRGWLEYVDWADAILAEPLRIEDGRAIPPNRMAWNDDAVARYRIA